MCTLAALFVMGLFVGIIVHWNLLLYIGLPAAAVFCAVSLNEEAKLYWILTAKVTAWMERGRFQLLRLMVSVVIMAPVMMIDLVWGLARGISLLAMLMRIVISCRNEVELEAEALES
ncbi:MAG: hypothetical protein RJB39_563 [Candidatus Parcubacteria bacterium]